MVVRYLLGASLMPTARFAQHSYVDGVYEVAVSAHKELAAEARCGAALARALVEHVCRMHAAGYDNEIVVDGEPWAVKVNGRTPPS